MAAVLSLFTLLFFHRNPNTFMNSISLFLIKTQRKNQDFLSTFPETHIEKKTTIYFVCMTDNVLKAFHRRYTNVFVSTRKQKCWEPCKNVPYCHQYVICNPMYYWKAYMLTGHLSDHEFLKYFWYIVCSSYVASVFAKTLYTDDQRLIAVIGSPCFNSTKWILCIHL